jgi:hypothetical protein
MATKKPKWPPARVFVVLSRALDMALDVSTDKDDIGKLFEDSEVEGRKPELYECHVGERLKATSVPPYPYTYELRPFPRRRTVAERAVGLGEIGGFGVDPKDSAALLELRAAIDEHLGWRKQKEEDAGDYVARVKQVAKMMRPFGLPAREPKKPGKVTAKKAKRKTQRVDGVDVPVGSWAMTPGGVQLVGRAKPKTAKRGKRGCANPSPRSFHFWPWHGLP